MLTNIRRRFLTMGGTIMLCVLSFVAVSATPAFASTTQTASSATATFQSANPPGPGQPNRGPGQPNRGPGQPNRGPGRGGNRQICPATVGFGDSGQAVRTLQRLLQDRGFRVRVTGRFDNQTLSAVRQFQRQHHWRADGVAGNAVWQALGQC
jgi:peptidoglycan hydrolase-like protein with peptidoglycan-binding domain